MTGFDHWTINAPQDVDSFDLETRLKDQDAPNPVYWAGDEEPRHTTREEFLRLARERAQSGSFEIHAATDVLVGTDPHGEPAFRLTGLECWTRPPATPEEIAAGAAAIDRHPDLPF